MKFNDFINLLRETSLTNVVFSQNEWLTIGDPTFQTKQVTKRYIKFKFKIKTWDTIGKRELGMNLFVHSIYPLQNIYEDWVNLQKSIDE